MNPKESKKWLENNKANLFVAKEFYHHHAFEILTTHSNLRKTFIEGLTSKINVVARIKKARDKRAKAIKAEDLNREIRKLLGGIPDNAFKFEVNEDRGVFYFSSQKSSIGGFDFAVLNHARNLYSLRNLCFGELHYHDGMAKWRKFLEKNKELAKIADELMKVSKIGMDVEYVRANKETPLIVGEIQFGNWALAYRDFFKVLKANVQNSIDCLIYVVPTGNLEAMLSDGIVTFDKTKSILQDFAKVISVPVWVVGLDVK